MNAATTDPILKIEPTDSEMEEITAYNALVKAETDMFVPAINITPKSGLSMSETKNNTAIKRESEASLTESVTVPITFIKMEAEKTARVLNMGGNEKQKLDRMRIQGRNILILCKRSCGSIAPNDTEEMINRFADARLYIDWLDTNVDMTPRINEVTKVDMVLTELIKPKNKVPEELVRKAEELLTKYKADNWGQDDVTEDPIGGTDEGSNGGPIGQAASAAQPIISVIQVPADNDPIFGLNGIMHGIVTDRTGKGTVYRIRADLPRKSPKVYGDNGIHLGSWYPFQICALFWGAHGARMGGIAGSVATGAWSIVVAGTYEDLDTDNGNTLYYSGSNSHDNTNPRQAAPPSQGTKALHASYRTQNPVRVLRSGGSFNSRHRNPHLPSCGLRYDGLYRVVGYRQRLNKKGGLYDQFKLERLEGQTPLSELERNFPTTEQVNARERL